MAKSTIISNAATSCFQTVSVNVHCSLTHPHTHLPYTHQDQEPPPRTETHTDTKKKKVKSYNIWKEKALFKATLKQMTTSLHLQ